MRRNWVTRATAGSKTIRTRIVAATAFSVSERAFAHEAAVVNLAHLPLDAVGINAQDAIEVRPFCKRRVLEAGDIRFGWNSRLRQWHGFASLRCIIKGRNK